jgi:hypothetical protein
VVFDGNCEERRHKSQLIRGKYKEEDGKAE